ncbi:NADH-quinone oxidoreductase subunit C [Streptomyces bullii]|uniref:NADH-quinone oxidoreductase subunit C n=1 Tax=Streptomyces bullii TaxID=349910 RepID=A0ABW0UX67_9ACTN
MSGAGWLPADVEELFGTEATAEESYEVLTVDVPPAAWISALETARDRLGCTYFDWLSAVDEPGTGFRVAAHLAALSPSPVRRLLLRTTVPHEAPVLASAVGVYAGAAWHERETHEMFGVLFEGHPALEHLLLPDGFEGHPLRKDFVLAARVAKAWPGAKEPGESEHGGPKRRQMLPPGVPDPNEWGPLKGQLPPAPARPARGAARAAGERPARVAAARAAGVPPVRRTRTAAEGSASQAAAPVGGTEPGAQGAPETPTTGPRRARTAAEGSAGQAATGPEAPTGGAASPPASGERNAPRRARSASEGSASQRPGASAAAPTERPTAEEPAADSREEGAPSPRRAPDVRAVSNAANTPETQPEETPQARETPNAPETPETAESTPSTDEDAGPARPQDRAAKAPTAPRSPDAPWHHARPAYDEPKPQPSPEAAPLPAPEAPEAPEPVNGADGDHGADGASNTDASNTGTTPEPGSLEHPEQPENPEDTQGGQR